MSSQDKPNASQQSLLPLHRLKNELFALGLDKPEQLDASGVHKIFTAFAEFVRKNASKPLPKPSEKECLERAVPWCNMTHQPPSQPSHSYTNGATHDTTANTSPPPPPHSLQYRFLHFSDISSQLAEEVKSGVVFGFTSLADNNVSYCMGCVDNEKDIPSGTTLMGVYCLTPSPSEEVLKDLCQKYSKSKKSGKLVVLTTICDQKELKTRFFEIKSKELCECSHEVVDDNEAIDQTIIVRLKANICLTFKTSIDTFVDNWTEELNKAKEDINSYDLELIQSCFKTNISATDKSFNSMTLTDLYGYLEEDPDLFDGIEVPQNMKKKMIEKMRKKKANDKSPLEFTAFNGSNSTKSDDTSEDIELSEDLKEVKLNIRIDSLSRIQEMNSISYLIKLFSNQMKQQLTSYGNQWTECVKSDKRLPSLQTYNFWPKNVSHFVSIVYPKSLSDEQLVSRRKEYHLRYLIRNDRPVFRKSNRFLLDNEKPKTDYLTSVHIGLKESGLKGGQTYCVYGDYTYHHYMQDRMDDNGWGCAYRSLQTIVSWFRHQSYIDKPVPSHTDIQQALVDVGDKQPSFVGSRQWIGSQEVSYVLSHLYEITSKIMFVNSGAELANKGRELAHHFTTNGTPIMIGGGVLAHTIIGIDFSEDTGDIKFLILDPHYTGGEDLNTIQKKGWCGWKASTFWDKNSFYNLCLPQRPDTY
ncbi:unnamed protein product [Oppiella nova]|uniref:Probable Ufm1-specific protease 2 n=1 Tax=Oppiella nova TaxID=334625 RepID=A0A7R9QFM6_9ACAR|nr:unnamed protein product [Oppiella nova]CAG2164875.1 unnamed protein product [Oppiella nova]